MGTTQSAVARWERGAVSPSLATAQALLHALGRRLEVTEDAPVLAPEERARIEENLRLTPEQRLARATAAARFVLAGRRALASAAARG